MDWRILSTDTVLAAARAWIKGRTDDPQTVGVGINKSGAAVMSELLARVEELEGALKPFAEHGEALEGCEPTDGWCEAVTPDGEWTHWLAVEHFFAARRALRGEMKDE